MGLRDAFGTEDSPDGEEVVTRVRLDEHSGQLIITRWRGDELLSESHERPREY